MIQCSNGKLEVNGVAWELDYPVLDAFAYDSNVIVLFDPDAGLKIPNFANLVCYGNDGEKIWVAELPTNKTADTYCGIISRSPLLLYSFCSYDVEIDPNTGKIIKQNFTK